MYVGEVKNNTLVPVLPPPLLFLRFRRKVRKLSEGLIKVHSEVEERFPFHLYMRRCKSMRGRSTFGVVSGTLHVKVSSPKTVPSEIVRG